MYIFNTPIAANGHFTEMLIRQICQIYVKLSKLSKCKTVLQNIRNRYCVNWALKKVTMETGLYCFFTSVVYIGQRRKETTEQTRLLTINKAINFNYRYISVLLYQKT